MPQDATLSTALGAQQQAPADWMPASAVGPFILNDPGVVWLEYHGARHGFQPDTSPYSFGSFVAEKGRQFEEAWLTKVAPGAVRVCSDAKDVREAEKVRETFRLMRQDVPLIAQAALWWAPECVFGAPDLLAHSTWLQAHFPELGVDKVQASQNHSQGHYVILELKYTTGLDERRKAMDLAVFAAQVRIYSYMLGQLQGQMPGQAYLVTRDRLFDPLPVAIAAQMSSPLDTELAAMRDQYAEIRVHGDRYLPWRDAIVASNPDAANEKWHTAKKTIAVEKTPGGDASLMYRVGPAAKTALAARGYPSLESLLLPNPEHVPFEEIKGLGAKRARQMRAVLEANRSGTVVLPAPEILPPQKPFEFYVDYEYFTNVNVDFQAQWPALQGCEMVFMIGVGWWDGADWRFRPFIAGQEHQDAEMEAFQQVLQFLQAATGGMLCDEEATALYHWSSAEVWQTRRVAERHGQAADHFLRHLPWLDLQKVFLNAPAALPGMWGFGLKAVASALGTLEPAFQTKWPGDLDAGLQAMVMGWRAYEQPEPLKTREMALLREYLETDCQALWQILRWLRARVGL